MQHTYSSSLSLAMLLLHHSMSACLFVGCKFIDSFLLTQLIAVVSCPTFLVGREASVGIDKLDGTIVKSFQWAESPKVGDGSGGFKH